MKLTHLTDQILLADTKKLADSERETTTQVLHHLAEIERRRLFSDLGYASLFQYACFELGYSEPAASRRVTASRLLKTIPSIESSIQDGALNLSTLAKAQRAFKKSNTPIPEQKKILDKLENKSAREAEKILMPLITPEKKEITFTLTIQEKTYDELSRVRNLLAHRQFNQDELLLYVLQAGEEKFLKEKLKTNLQKEVFQRDQGRCVNCGSNFKLEFDHMQPRSLGGQTCKENLRLFCFSCNQRARMRAGL